MADAPTSIYINNEELPPVRPLLGATRLSRANHISLISALASDAPSPPPAPVSLIKSSNSSVDDVLYNNCLTATEFSQADFDSWYNYQYVATRELVSYADHQHYALHGSGSPYSQFPARSMRHISQNSILQVNILIGGIDNIGTFDLDPVKCQTMDDFVHTLETAVLDQEIEVPQLQGSRLYLGHFLVGVYSKNIQLVIMIDGPGTIIIWESW